MLTVASCSVRGMGAWGAGPFENDAAGDFVAEMTHREDSNDGIVEALQHVVDAEDYLEVDEGGSAIAAAELVAAALGRGLETMPKSLVLLVERLRPRADAELAKLAARAVERVTGDASEVAELWAENGPDNEWQPFVASLRERLAAHQ